MASLTELPARMDLAHEPDIRLGAWLVRPSACRLSAAGHDERLEPRVMEVFVVLMRAAGRTVTREDLINACWGGRFVSDDAVGRAIAQLRHMARRLDPPAFALETVPKVGFRLTLSDPAPEPAAPELRPARRPSAFPGGRRIAMAAAVTLLGLGSAIGLWRAVAGASSGPQQSGRVEVMLFEPLRPDADLRRFALVLGDSVVRLLSGAGVETTQRPRTRDTGGTDERSEFRIAGTVDRDGPRLVINAQLLERADGEVLWSERFVGPSSAGTAAQDEAAGAIADTLECALSARSRSKARISSTALSRMLNACRHRRDDPARFLALTRQLAQAAPDLSVAHSMYATAAAALLGDDTSSEDKQALARTVRAEAARALALEPQNGEAYFALGLAMSQQRRWRQEEAYYVRAAELSPDLRLVDDHYVDTLREVGRLRDALSADQRAAANDPFSGDQLRSLALLLAATGQLPEAEAVIDRLDAIDADRARDARFQAAFWWQAPQAARRSLRALAGRRVGRTELACYEAYLARLASAHKAALRGLPSGCAGAPADWRIRMLARQGDVDGAYAEAAKASPDVLIAILFYPEMKAFRRDPRFMPLARSFGLVDYWRSSGHWPDFCAEPDLPYDCRKAATRL